MIDKKGRVWLRCAHCRRRTRFTFDSVYGWVCSVCNHRVRKADRKLLRERFPGFIVKHGKYAEV